MVKRILVPVVLTITLAGCGGDDVSQEDVRAALDDIASSAQADLDAEREATPPCPSKAGEVVSFETLQQIATIGSCRIADDDTLALTPQTCNNGDLYIEGSVEQITGQPAPSPPPGYTDDVYDPYATVRVPDGGTGTVVIDVDGLLAEDEANPDARAIADKECE